MAYNLHIAKANYWEISDPEIPLEIWLGYCKSDASMRLEEKITGVNPKTNDVIEVGGDGICVWTDPATKNEYTFYYSSGRITLGTDDNQIKKAKEIANKLGVKVYGDEGEEY